MIAETHLGRIHALLCAEPPCPNDLADATFLEAWQPCLSAQGFPALWGVLMDHPRLGRRPVLTPRLLLIDRCDGWARSLQGLIRLGLSFARQRALAPPQLHGIARQIRMIETAGYVSIDPKMLESLLSDFARAVRLMHACWPRPARWTESPWIGAGQSIDDRSPG
ncbi:DUF6634 family protein [Paracoccus versutus]|uniref:DUF6634 family protein n=1 Tax=Paracoccus versutus TaxID=34007 RepID=UPI0015F11378|nr:DUF6634 family protein [Paracoccus versutus]